MNTAILYRLLSLVLFALCAGFTACIVTGLIMGEQLSDRSTLGFCITILVALVLGGVFYKIGQRGEPKIYRREALCAIGLSWFLATFIGALPYLIIVEDCAFADALFESASGLTTTGSTAFANFHEFPKSLLLWRSLSQWFGGLGVVVFFVALLSSFGAGAKILFSNESSGASADFDQGRVQKGAFQLMLLYVGLSLACMLAYKLAGMDWFRAINHAMTTIATGGFSTEPMSIEQFQSAPIEWVAIVFMFLGGTTFVFMIRLLRGQMHVLRYNNEVYWYVAILLCSTLLLLLYLVELKGKLPDHDMVRAAAFQTVSIATTTGFNSTDFDTWLSPAKMLLVILMIIGGCSGSTSGGIKVVRIVIATRAALRSIIHSFRPNITIPMRIGGTVMSERAIQSTILFLMLIVSLQVVSMVFVSAIEPELSFLGTFSAVQATLFNIGPGFDAVGPSHNFQFLHGITKSYLAFLMILGRLELYAALVLFVPSIWKRFS